MKRLILAALLTVTACGRQECAQKYRGVCLEAPGPRIDRFVDGALAFWGAPDSAIAGTTLHTTSGQMDCSGVQAYGCTYSDMRDVTLDINAYPACPYYNLVHELGHVILNGDGNHTDPRWHQVTPAQPQESKEWIEE